MTGRPRRHRLKDGRLSGVLTRRLLNGAVKYPGVLIPMETLAQEVWGAARPKTWRICLAHQVVQLNARLGKEVLIRVGTHSEIQGFRLDIRALPAGNVTAKPSKAPKRWPWTPNEDAVIVENVPGLPLADLTTLVNRAHGHQHSPRAVEARIYELGLSKKGAATYSVSRLAPILGTHHEKVVRWIERGILAAERWDPSRQAVYRNRPGWWMIRPADVEAFLRAYPWEVDWRAMQAGHPLTLLAQSVQRRDPYLTIAEAARRVGLSVTALWQRIDAGMVPTHVRLTPVSKGSSPDRSAIRIPLSALADVPARLPKGPRPAALRGVAL